MKKIQKKKIRIPLPKQIGKIQDTDKKKYNREHQKRIEFMKMMGWSE